MYLEKVQSYKYLQSTAKSDNSIEEEIQHRITLGNKAYCSKQFLFKSRLVSKKSKMKLYCSIIRPTVTFVCETWVLKQTIKSKLMVLLRKIFGPTKERDGTWRIKINNELDKLIRHKNIIKVHKSTKTKLVKKYISGNQC
jgi:hypothetical protein